MMVKVEGNTLKIHIIWILRGNCNCIAGNFTRDFAARNLGNV